MADEKKTAPVRKVLSRAEINEHEKLTEETVQGFLVGDGMLDEKVLSVLRDNPEFTLGLFSRFHDRLVPAVEKEAA